MSGSLGTAPVGSLRDLQELLEGRGDVFEQRPFPFYGVLLYTPTNGLNKLLHEYVVSHFEFFNFQTGPNWLVAVVEDINRNKSIKEFKPQDVYKIARFLGVPVDAIPSIIFFTEPKEHNETLVLNLRDLFPEVSVVTDDELTKFFGKLAATIDKICLRNPPKDERLESLHQALKQEWAKDPTWGDRLRLAMNWLNTSATTATTVLGAISGIVEFLKATGIYPGK